MKIVSFIMLALYALGIIAVVLYANFRKKTSKDFFLGGRKIGGWLSAFSYGTTYFSAVIFIGYTGSVGWGFGLPAVFVGLGNALIGSYLAWRILARRTRYMTHHLGVNTMPTFFEKRYQSRTMKFLAAAIIFVFLVPYSASVYKGIGILFETIFGIDFIYCMILMAALTAFYVLFGGYLTTAMVGFIQGIIMLAGVVLMTIFIMNAPEVGGLNAGLAKLADLDPALVAAFPTGFDAIVSLVSLIVLTSLGCWGLPQMVHKFYAIKDHNAIVRGTVISSVFALIIGGSAYFLGAFGRLFTNNALPAGGVDYIVPQMLFTALPDAMLGLVLVLVLSASMSTLSSLVLVSASAVTVDLMQDTLLQKASEKTVNFSFRFFSLLFVALSMAIALWEGSPILVLMSFSWGSLAGAFLGPFVFGLFDKRTNAAGAFAGMFAGLLTAFIFALVTQLDAKQTPLGGSCAMLVSLTVTPLVSRFTRPMQASYVSDLFNFKA